MSNCDLETTTMKESFGDSEARRKGGVIPAEVLEGDENAMRHFQELRKSMKQVFVQTKAHLEYPASEMGSLARTKHEWIKGLYDYLLTEAKEIINRLPSSKDLEDDAGAKNGGPELTTESTVDLKYCLEAIDRLGICLGAKDPKLGKDTAWAKATNEGTLAGMRDASTWDAMEPYMTTTELSEEQEKHLLEKLQNEIRRAEELPDFSE